MPPKPKPKRFKSRTLVVVSFWVVVAGLLLYNQQGIADAWKLHGYQPPAEVASLATDNTFTLKARDVFYVNHPIVTAQKEFADNCPSGTERTVVLGCYHGDQAGIYVLKVTDARLQGVEQVTSAHEMLHAEYDRLSSRQKRSVDAMLNDFYAHGLTDDTVKQQIDDYKKSEPKDVVNEMHSLFATEVKMLPANLENYYQRYFTNRVHVVDLYNQYEAEFTTRQATIKSDDIQLSAMKAQIDSSEQSIDKQSTSLDAQRVQLDRLKASGSIQAYNAAVPAYNAAVDAYNAQASALRSLIARYNQLVDERNSIAAETNQLTAEISNQVTDK